MSKIRGENTLPELKFKKNNKQFEYQPKDLTGKPDFTIRKEKESRLTIIQTKNKK